MKATLFIVGVLIGLTAIIAGYTIQFVSKLTKEEDPPTFIQWSKDTLSKLSDWSLDAVRWLVILFVWSMYSIDKHEESDNEKTMEYNAEVRFIPRWYSPTMFLVVFIAAMLRAVLAFFSQIYDTFKYNYRTPADFDDNDMYEWRTMSWTWTKPMSKARRKRIIFYTLYMNFM